MASQQIFLINGLYSWCECEFLMKMPWILQTFIKVAVTLGGCVLQKGFQYKRRIDIALDGCV